MSPRRPTHLCTGEFELDWMLVYELLRTRLQKKRAVFSTTYISINLVRVCDAHPHGARCAAESSESGGPRPAWAGRGTSPPRPPHTPAGPSSHDGSSAVGLHSSGDAWRAIVRRCNMQHTTIQHTAHTPSIPWKRVANAAHSSATFVCPWRASSTTICTHMALAHASQWQRSLLRLPQPMPATQQRRRDGGAVRVRQSDVPAWIGRTVHCTSPSAFRAVGCKGSRWCRFQPHARTHTTQEDQRVPVTFSQVVRGELAVPFHVAHHVR